MANGPIGLPAAQHFHTAAWPQGLLEVFGQVQAMNSQQLNPLNSEQAEAALQLGFKGSGVILRRNLGLQDARRIGIPRQSRSELQL